MASREAYQIPASSGFAMMSSGNQGGGASTSEQLAANVKYNCGDCNMECKLERSTGVRCFHCGGRVLYKQRTKR
jgi:DNA-directed RNA polymerases I, II, and III subunit RPABC4